VSEPTYLVARDDGGGVLFDGRAPLLATPYYWPYVYALTHLHEHGAEGTFMSIGYLLMPTEGD
jgi:hypothetical protein